MGVHFSSTGAPVGAAHAAAPQRSCLRRVATAARRQSSCTSNSSSPSWAGLRVVGAEAEQIVAHVDVLFHPTVSSLHLTREHRLELLRRRISDWRLRKFKMQEYVDMDFAEGLDDVIELPWTGEEEPVSEYPPSSRMLVVTRAVFAISMIASVAAPLFKAVNAVVKPSGDRRQMSCLIAHTGRLAE